MIVRTLEHAALVKKRIERLWELTGRRYIAWDTETKRKAQYNGDKDGLIIGRADATFLSMCYKGEAYSFPTSFFSARYPDPEAWGRFFEDWWYDPTVIKVMHNANYDYNIAHYSMDIPALLNIWDTMIGGWKAAEYKEKSLKDRAPEYGRYWRETKTVNFSNLYEVAEYAEQDVIQTDEMFQMQYYGAVERPRTILQINETGTLVSFRNPLPAGRLVIPDEVLSPFDKNWVMLFELPVLRATIRAERRGLPLDVTQVREIRKVLTVDVHKTLRTMFRMAGQTFNPGSPQQLSHVATNVLGINNPFKAKSGKNTSWNAKVLAKLRGVHPFIDALREYKDLEKMVDVYIGTAPLDIHNYPKKNNAGLEYYVNTITGAIHATAGTVNAKTGRGSSSNPNLQQIPSRKDRYGLKKCFTAVPKSPLLVYAPKYRKELLLIDLDYAQLEIRVMALLSKDEAMTRVLADPNGDIHTNTANEFGVDRDPHAKNLNFLLLYGGQSYMLSETLSGFGVKTSQAQAQGYIDLQAKVYPGVPAYRLDLLDYHKKHGYVRLFTGRRRTLPDIDWDSPKSVHKAETTLSNNVVQGSGQDFLKAAIIRADYSCINIDKELPIKIAVPALHRAYLREKAAQVSKYRKILKAAECKFRLQVHDEVLYSVQPKAAEECLHILADIMSWRHPFPATSDYNVPLVAEGGVASNWKDAKSKDKTLYRVKKGFDEFKRYA